MLAPQAVEAPDDGWAPQVEVVIPVRDEEHDLGPSVRRLHAHLRTGFAFTWRITVVDNGSTDGTWDVARHLAASLPGVRAVRLERPGRGRALRHAWSRSDADVVAYMDVDLSTDLAGLLPLVSPLLSGHSDVVIGSRLARGARVVRGPKREVISRAYNLLLRVTFRARFRDAQCGFKALRADTARRLLDLVEDDGWFFDTELLLVAQRQGLRVLELPVDWVDDPGSRVDIVRTALDDLRGLARLARRFATGQVPAGDGAGGSLPAGLGRQAARFAGIGAVSTLAHLGLFVLLRQPLGPLVANLVALGLTAVGNTLANRRVTFGVRGAERRGRHLVEAGGVFVATTALSTGALAAVRVLVPAPSAAVDVATVLVAQVLATGVRFLALRHWVFAASRNQAEVAA